MRTILPALEFHSFRTKLQQKLEKQIGQFLDLVLALLFNCKSSPHTHSTVTSNRTIVLEGASLVRSEFYSIFRSTLDSFGSYMELIDYKVMHAVRVLKYYAHFVSFVH